MNNSGIINSMRASYVKGFLAGMSDKEAAAFSYMLFFVSGFFFFLVKRDSFVKFHALQSILVFGTLFLILWILNLVPFLQTLVSLIGLLIFVMWLILIHKAWQGEEWEVPMIGHYARRLAKK